MNDRTKNFRRKALRKLNAVKEVASLNLYFLTPMERLVVLMDDFENYYLKDPGEMKPFDEFITLDVNELRIAITSGLQVMEGRHYEEGEQYQSAIVALKYIRDLEIHERIDIVETQTAIAMVRSNWPKVLEEIDKYIEERGW